MSQLLHARMEAFVPVVSSEGRKQFSKAMETRGAVALTQAIKVLEGGAVAFQREAQCWQAKLSHSYDLYCLW